MNIMNLLDLNLFQRILNKSFFKETFLGMLRKKTTKLFELNSQFSQQKKQHYLIPWKVEMLEKLVLKLYFIYKNILVTPRKILKTG